MSFPYNQEVAYPPASTSTPAEEEVETLRIEDLVEETKTVESFVDGDEDDRDHYDY